jgi:transcriptional regulator with XRE-family HTH domain
MEHVYRIDTEKLKKARGEAGLSLAGLAVKTGMDVYHLALVEQQLHVPTLTSLRGITRALGLPTHTVIEWKTGAFARESLKNST